MVTELRMVFVIELLKNLGRLTNIPEVKTLNFCFNAMSIGTFKVSSGALYSDGWRKRTMNYN